MLLLPPLIVVVKLSVMNVPKTNWSTMRWFFIPTKREIELGGSQWNQNISKFATEQSICALLLFKLAVRLRTSGASKNPDWPGQNGVIDRNVVTLRLLEVPWSSYVWQIFLTNFLTNFFDQFLWRIFLTNFFEEFFWQIFWQIFLTNFLMNFLIKFLTIFVIYL